MRAPSGRSTSSSTAPGHRRRSAATVPDRHRTMTGTLAASTPSGRARRRPGPRWVEAAVTGRARPGRRASRLRARWPGLVWVGFAAGVGGSARPGWAGPGRRRRAASGWGRGRRSGSPGTGPVSRRSASSAAASISRAGGLVAEVDLGGDQDVVRAELHGQQGVDPVHRRAARPGPARSRGAAARGTARPTSSDTLLRARMRGDDEQQQADQRSSATPSHSSSPVSWDRPRPSAASSRPIRAALSSRKTALTVVSAVSRRNRAGCGLPAPGLARGPGARARGPARCRLDDERDRQHDVRRSGSRRCARAPGSW